MATPYESAQLLLHLYDVRREAVLREARQWFVRDFTPETFEEMVGIITGQRNASYRMVVGYWDMAASFVTFGAVDPEMFRAASGEIFETFSKILPFLPQLRERSGNPDFARYIESVVMGFPGGPERVAVLRDQFLARKRAGR